MRHHKTISGKEIDLSKLDGERWAFYELAREKMRHDASWFDFEAFAFSFSSPVFRDARDRSQVINDPLYLALKDIWLRLGMKQGLVAGEQTGGDAKKEKARKARSNRSSRSRHVAPADQPRRAARRSR